MIEGVPRAVGALPLFGDALGPAPDFLRDPSRFLARTRARLGDTFSLELFGFRLLFVFSGPGVAALYALPERVASFSEATRTLIGFKLPDELLAGDMALFHKLFTAERVPRYLDHMRTAVRAFVAELPARGELEIFSSMKGLVHRLAFVSWLGPEALAPGRLTDLIVAYEALDPEEAFVHPARMLLTVLTRKVPERRALGRAAALIGEIAAERRAAGATPGTLEALGERYSDLSARDRAARVARDVMILHLASLSNLYAALGWTLVHLADKPALRAAAEAVDEATVARVAHEAIRVAQRSITLRKVLAPCEVDDGVRRVALAPGMYLATMLSVTNSAFPGFDAFDPARWDDRGRLLPGHGLPASELVSTFGHGAHACPGQRFAIQAILVAVRELFAALELSPRWDEARTKRGQIGAVARADAPCVLAFRRRGGPA